MKARVHISRDLATLRPPLRWRWFVELHGPGQHGHLFAFDKVGQLTPLRARLDFLRHGLKWLLKAWWL